MGRGSKLHVILKFKLFEVKCFCEMLSITDNSDQIAGDMHASCWCQ